MKMLKRLLTVLLISACASSAFASLPTKTFLPYVDTSLWPTFSLTNCNKVTGQKYFMLAFIIADGTGQPSWNGATPISDKFMLTDIQGLRSKGGDVAVSFGGAAGTPIDSTITDVNSLVTAYSTVIDTYNLTWIDFDIEGFWIADSASVSRRNQAAAKLQAKYPGLRISYTLPVLQSGLTQDGINVVNGAKSAGVNIYCINVMAMDYGGAVSDMASAATSAASATRSQTGLNIGITPMIGQNDAQGEIFTLANARTVLSFATGTSYVNTLAFWSAGRDNGGCPGQTSASATCSGLSQTNFQFIATWKSYSGAGTPPPPDFSLSASPASVSITQGSGGTSTISVNSLNGFTGSVSLSASGLPAGVSASFNPASTTTSSTLTLSASSTAVTGTKTITVTGTSGSLTHTTSLTLTVNASGGGGALPAGWSDADIGAVGVAGNASYNAGTFTINGSGTDIFGTGDQCNLAYESVSGDQTVIARVVSEMQTAAYAKAGVMLRESTASGAVNASVLITPTNGVAMEVRSTTGAATINVVGWVRGVLPPHWVKLVRSGSTFTASYSADGATWTQFASTNVTMASSTLAGLAVTAHNNAALNTGTFDNVSIAGNSPPPDFSLSASPSSVAITQSSSGTSTITETDLNGYSGTVTLSASGLPMGVTASFNPASTTSSSTLTLTASSTAATGTATITITGTDGTLSHTTSISLTVSATSGPIDTTKIYKLQNVASGLVLNNQGSLTNGSKITQWSASTSSDNLRWRFIATDSGYYQINSVKSGLDAVVQSASTAQGAGIIQWAFGAAQNDQWLPQANSDGTFTFINRHSGLVLEDPGSSTSTSTQMDQWGTNGGANQKWTLIVQ